MHYVMEVDRYNGKNCSRKKVIDGILYLGLWLEASTRASALCVQRQPVVIRCHSFGELGDGIIWNLRRSGRSGQKQIFPSSCSSSTQGH